MSPIEDLVADLLHEQAETTNQAAPPLATIVELGEASSLQRKRTIGALAVAAVVLLIVSIAINVRLLDGDRDPQPSRKPVTPSATPTTHGTAQTALPPGATVVRGEGVSHATAVAASGEVATLWFKCKVAGGSVSTPCANTWVLTDGHRSWTGPITTAADESTGADAVRDTGSGFLVTSVSGDDPGMSFVLGYDGTTTPLRRDDALVSHPSDPSVQGVLVLHDDESWIASAKLGTWAPLVATQSNQSFPGLAYGQTIWVGDSTGGKPFVRWLTGANGWRSHPLVTHSPDLGTALNGPYPGPIAAARGGLVAAASLQVADDRDLLVGLSVSRDGGASWTDIPGADLPFLADPVPAGATPPGYSPVRGIVDMAASADGVLYVSSDSGQLYRSTDPTWTHFELVDGIDRASSLEPIGEDKVIVARDIDGARILTSIDDHGATSDLAAVVADPAYLAALGGQQ